MPSLDTVLSSSVLLTLAALLTVVVTVVLVRSTIGSRRRAPSRREIAARVADVAAPLDGQKPEAAVENDGLDPYRWALAVREESMGPDHPDVAAACHILGAMYLERERFTEAEPLLQRALQIRVRSLGPSHSDVASTLDDLVTLFRALGQEIEADTLREVVLGPRSPAPAVALKSEDAKPPLAPAREIAPEPVDRPAVPTPQRRGPAPAPPMQAVTPPSSGAEEPDLPDPEELTRVLREIAGLRGADAEPSSAQQLYRSALAMMEATGATDRPELRTALHELGRLYYRQGAYAEAEPLLERALALAREATDAAAIAEISDDLAWLQFSRRSLTEH